MGAKRTILIIDDTESLLIFLQKSFEKAGYTVLTAEDGQQGLQVALSSSPDVILSDVVMPEMDGYELCRQLKRHAVTQSIPVVLLTGMGDSASTVKGFEAGADEYISKPFEIKEVLARISRILKWVAPQKDRAPKISGTLDKTPFFDLLRFCEEHRITGTLFVSREIQDGGSHVERKGEIRLKLGEIDSVSLGEMTDLTDVLDELLEWPNGTFSVFQEDLHLPADEAVSADDETPETEQESVTEPESRVRDMVAPILRELQTESDDLKYAIILDSHGSVIGEVSESGQTGDAALQDMIFKTLCFSERVCQELDLGEFDETLIASEKEILILYPIDSFGALGVETLKENQGMVRWNCRDAIVKIRETL